MIVAGFGFRAAASAASLCDALAQLGASEIDGLATAADKAGAACLQDLARQMGHPVFAVGPEAIVAQRTETQSPKVAAHRGTGSVAEAAALAAAGPGARLISARAVSRDRLASCALAEGPGAGRAAR